MNNVNNVNKRVILQTNKLFNKVPVNLKLKQIKIFKQKNKKNKLRKILKTKIVLKALITLKFKIINKQIIFKLIKYYKKNKKKKFFKID